jgi:hypothetical protein
MKGSIRMLKKFSRGYSVGVRGALKLSRWRGYGPIILHRMFAIFPFSVFLYNLLSLSSNQRIGMAVRAFFCVCVRHAVSLRIRHPNPRHNSPSTTLDERLHRHQPKTTYTHRLPLRSLILLLFVKLDQFFKKHS